VQVEYGNDQDVRTLGSGFAASLVEANHTATVEADDGSLVPPPPAGADEGVAVSHCFPAHVPVDVADPSFYKRTGWNLNNLPFLQPSVLRHVNEEINGVNVPWLYLGMLFSTFCWHNEDHYLFSINYMHHGEAKTWYGVPGFAAEGFEAQLRAQLAEQQGSGAGTVAADAQYHITTVVPPWRLTAAGVPVYRLLQEPGHFVVTFPQAYHAGFSHGFNVAEACNFALPEWLPFGAAAAERYRTGGAGRADPGLNVIVFPAPTKPVPRGGMGMGSAGMRSLVFSHEQLVCNLALHAADYPPSQHHWCVHPPAACAMSPLPPRVHAWRWGGGGGRGACCHQRSTPLCAGSRRRCATWLTWSTVTASVPWWGARCSAPGRQRHGMSASPAAPSATCPRWCATAPPAAQACAAPSASRPAVMRSCGCPAPATAARCAIAAPTSASW